MNEPWKNTGHPMDGKISKVLENLEDWTTTLGNIARKIDVPPGTVAWHLRECITGYLLEKPKNGRIEDTKVTRACEIVELALKKVNAETGGVKK